MKALYAYFGEFGMFDKDIPGHSFYQIGLLSAISEEYKIDKFDVYNYLDEVDAFSRPIYSNDDIGHLMNKTSDELIDLYRIPYKTAVANIADRGPYDYLFLKARFRNLSTLSKKLEDATRFEDLIMTAIQAGYAPSRIIVLDTDLSMSQSFSKTLANLGVVVKIPSIDFPGIGRTFLQNCLTIHKENNDIKSRTIIYHGNIDFTNYKEGHSKNPIIQELIKSVNYQSMFDTSKFFMNLCAKKTEELEAQLENMPRVQLIPRTDRAIIWKWLKESMVSLNVSKDLYLKRGFIPARVYEAVIAGTIPVSYSKGQHPAMTFETISEFYEICKFLAECSPSDYYKVLEAIAKKL